MNINNTDHRPEECGNDFGVHYSGQISDGTFSGYITNLSRILFGADLGLEAFSYSNRSRLKF